MRVVSLIMLPIWSVLALLGHSGTHALADWLGVCCHVETGVSDVEPGEQPGGRHVCQHCTRTYGPHDSDPVSKDQQPVQSPAHDSKNCRLCEWLLGWQPQVPPSSPALRAESWELLQRIIEVQRVSCQSIPAVSRGPPVA